MTLTKEQLEGKTPEQILELLNTEVDTLNQEVEKQKGIAKDAILKRDTIKEEIRLLKEGKIDEATKAEIKRLEGLLETSNTKITGFETLITDLKNKQAQAEARATESEKKTREALIAKLPESHKKFAEKIIDVNDLEEYVNLNAKDKNIETDKNFSLPADFFNGKKWDDLTITEKDELQKKNPMLYKKLLNERNKK